MSAIQLVNRAAGQVILQNFYNDIHSALEGDFIGRDVNGNPVAGNNCGTSAYPWGTGYFDQLVIGGAALGISGLENSPYQIVSGKTRSGSNQPAFLVPAGSAATFSLLASSVNLVLQVNGIAATWTADKNSIPVTTAPASNNTALVNDTTASNQAATRTWGEYGSGVPYYPITIDTVGSNITARVGTFQAFKVGTEYFIAFVESTTSLSRAFRGYFFNSSGNPVQRTTLADDETITLMNLGYVFADQDTSTVDTIFVGGGINNAPVMAYTAPGSPATGDYWFDQANQVWKRYTGSVWAIVNRIPVGVVIADATNCVGARAFDFYGLYRSDNTIELAWYSNTVLKGVGLCERINVMGKRISFQTSRATWDTASNLAASTDRYNSSVQASSTEYFYVTDQGDTKISDIEPSWRPDLLGWFHPFNPWRCVGQNGTDGSANFQASTIVNQSPIPNGSLLPPVNLAISGSSSSYSNSTEGSYAAITGLSISIPTSGSRPVIIALISDGSGTPAFLASQSAGAGNAACNLRLKRGSTGIADWQLQGSFGSGTTVNSGTIAFPCIFHVDRMPGAGIQTYSFFGEPVATAFGETTLYAQNLNVIAFELP